MEEEKLLGKQVEYPKSYCPEILVGVPRVMNREIYGIDEPETLFCGYDSWHAYETSFLLNNGMPIVGILKIVYPATSVNIVESKSLKLYLGSFSMVSLGNTKEEATTQFVRTIKADLSLLLGKEAEVTFYAEKPETEPFDFNDYRILEDMILPENIRFSEYQENPELLTNHSVNTPGELKICSHLLKSNCKITNQPDWGSVYIYIKADVLPAAGSLLKYIVSLRNENHFHEEICEMMFKRLTDLFHPDALSICCLYTRRGGIDICPVRASQPEFLPNYLPRADILTKKSFRQ